MLEPEIVCGICEQESTWIPDAMRFELGWFNRLDWGSLIKTNTFPRLSSFDTEKAARSTSYGLMQTLGQSVREIGFTDWMPALCDPATGIEWGCRLFTRKLSAAGGDIPKALLFWNGGGNPYYPSQVLARSEAYK